MISTGVREVKALILNGSDAGDAGLPAEISMNRIRFRLLTLLVAVALAGALCFVAVQLADIVDEATKHAGAPNFAQLRVAGDKLITRIETFRDVHGRYPDSMEEAGLVSPTADYGGFRYTRDENGSFRLFIGNTSKYRFYLFWHSSLGAWEIDR